MERKQVRNKINKDCYLKKEFTLDMRKYNILFCDDQERAIKDYKSIISKNNVLSERIDKDKIYISHSFNKNIEDIKSIKNIVKENKENNIVIDIAIVDMNFEKIKGIEEIDENNTSFERLGIKIVEYLMNEYKNIEILFVSGYIPDSIKEANKLLDSKISLFDKENKFELFAKIEEKMLTIFKEKDSQQNLLDNYEPNQYMYEITGFDLKNNKITIKNNRIYNKETLLEVGLMISRKPLLILAKLILLSCYDENKMAIYDNPIEVTSEDLKESLITLKEYELDGLYKNNEGFIKTIFHKLSSNNNEEPLCHFNKKEAKNLDYGSKHDNRTIEKEPYCYDTCKTLLKDYSICLMLLSYSEVKIPIINISNDINRLKKDIEKNIQDKKDLFESYIWDNDSKISYNCCTGLNYNEIKSCRFPICQHSLIFSDQVITNKGKTNYIFKAKPSMEVITELQKFLEQSPTWL